VQLRRRGHFCITRRLLTRFFANPVPLPFRCCAAVLRTLRVKRCHTADDECRDCHHHKEANRLEFSGHYLALEKHKRRGADTNTTFVSSEREAGVEPAAPAGAHHVWSPTIPST